MINYRRTSKVLQQAWFDFVANRYNNTSSVVSFAAGFNAALYALTPKVCSVCSTDESDDWTIQGPDEEGHVFCFCSKKCEAEYLGS